MLVAVSTSRLSCKRAGKTRTLMPVWDSSGESRFNYLPIRIGLALTPKCVATGRQPPYRTPAETPAASLPIAIELDPPPSSSIPSLAPRFASYCNTRRGETYWPRAKNKSLRSRSMAAAVRASGERLLPPQTLPPCNQTACPPIPHFARASSAAAGGFDGRRPSVAAIGNATQRAPVNRDFQLLFINNVADAAQPVLPPLCDGDRIERSDIELDIWRRQIDAHPVDQAVPLFGCIQPFTTVSNALKDFSGDREPHSGPCTQSRRLSGHLAP